MIRVAIVDDHPHVAIALRTLLDQTPDLRPVAEARRGGEVMNLVRSEVRRADRARLRDGRRAGIAALNLIRLPI